MSFIYIIFNVIKLIIRVKYLVLITLLVIVFTSCNSSNGDSLEKSSQSFLFEKNNISRNDITDIIKKSNLKKGGYVIIIPTSFNVNDEQIKKIKHQFNRQHILAVHPLIFKPDLPIKNTDVIAIENASVICFTDGNTSKFVNLINTSALKESFLKAKENGAVFVGIGNGSSVIKEIVISDS